MGVQKPVYYVSRSLVGAEINYLPIEKLVLALTNASTKLRYYFDAHPNKVLTSTPMKASLHRSDLSGRIEKWFVKLSIFHIEYEPRTAIKGQVLTDFIVKFTDRPTDSTEGTKKRHWHQLATHLLQLGARTFRCNGCG